ncbi:hypothetical protein [Tamaricihabitans halophyticus]|uniref:hypothetical protein n=1 Tax=Tamaricihabitans halophyticus TaxID=1262583 RepID=UPI001FB51112|nr:hypothetical protein [Tamaricihabitans halophyticus]
MSTTHELAYAGRLLVSSTCQECGHTIERDVRDQYVADLRHRMASKPRRMLRRFRRRPWSYAWSLPKAAAAKPLGVLRELRLVARAASDVQRREEPNRKDDEES